MRWQSLKSVRYISVLNKVTAISRVGAAGDPGFYTPKPVRNNRQWWFESHVYSSEGSVYA